VVALAVGRARSGVDDDDLERPQRMADALQLGLDVLRGDDVAVAPRSKVELHARLKAPFERHLVDGDRALASVHRRGEVIGRVEVRAVVGHEADPLDRPALGAAQAEAMAERLAPLGALPIVTSPLRRTRETAAPLERRWRFTARIDPAVGEIPSPMEDPAARGEWLRGVMAGVWSAQADDLKL